ncbi:hypothetical protein OEZ86_005406 [Tetradesmus obliquus]|nr:hypothetical protein OEZ86_005406 [Tetradesmus obliquus]
MAKLQAATSNAEEDDVAAMQELDKMRTCMAVALIVPVSKGLTYEAAPAEVHRMAVNASITAARLLRLWADRPCVLQGSSAAARLTTAVVRYHISFPWEGESRTKVRRYALTPGFVSAYSTACEALAAALDKARAADVPQHIAEMAAMLLGVWQAAVAMFDDAGALEDSTMFSLVLPVVQLAGAALRCWAGPAAASSSSSSSSSRTEATSNAINAAVDVGVILFEAAAEAAETRNRPERAPREALLANCSSISSSQELQWLLCTCVVLLAQALHTKQNGLQCLVAPAAGSSQAQQQQQQQQQQQVKCTCCM